MYTRTCTLYDKYMMYILMYIDVLDMDLCTHVHAPYCI